MAASERPVILLGCPRSGTTLLQVMLSAHPRLAVAPETRFVLDAYRGRVRFGDLREAASRRALADWIVGRPASRWADLGLPAARVVGAVVGSPPTLGSALAAVFASYAGAQGAARWGDKRPAYYRDVAALRRLYPSAQFVSVVRDGRDCVASLRRMRWYREGTLAAVATWMEAVDAARWWRRRLPPDGWYDVRYEALVTDPEGELRGLCAFLGEGYLPAMAAPERVAARAVPARKTWHVRTRQPVDAARVGAYRDGLPPVELALIETVAGGRLRRLGYPLTGAGRPPARLLGRFAAVATHRRLAHVKQHARDAVRDRRLGDDVADRTELS